MKPVNNLQGVNAGLPRVLFACLLLAAGSAAAFAQTPAGRSNPTEPPAAAQTAGANTSGATADEDFELNIDLRHIRESVFEAETEVETSGARGLRLRIGVALRAGDIDVLLRNVRGHVRFRANLAPVLRLLDARNGAGRTATPPATSP